MGNKLYVGSLAYSVTSEDLNDLFAKYGSVVSSQVISDKHSGQSKGFGFVEMEASSEAKEAMASLNGHEISGRALRVSEAREQEPRRSQGSRY